jgi:hypothetical protein
LVRLAASVLLGASLAVSLGFLYGVQRTIDLAAYSDAKYEVQSEIAASPADEASVVRDFGSQVFLGAMWRSRFVSRSGSDTDVTVVMASDHSVESMSYFPDSARIAGPDPAAGSNWVDLSADLARSLGVHIGDSVTMPIPDSARGVEYRVRSIYAARLLGVQNAAIAASAPAFAAISGSDEEQFLEILVSGKSPTEVAQILSEPKYRKLLEQGKTYPPVITSREENLRAADAGSTTSLALVGALAAVALFGGLAFVAREVDVFRRHADPTLLLLVRLGANPRALILRLALVAGGVLAASLTAGSVIGVQLFQQGVLAPCFPPTLLPTLALTGLAMGVAAEVFLALALWRSARRVVER